MKLLAATSGKMSMDEVRADPCFPLKCMRKFEASF